MKKEEKSFKQSITQITKKSSTESIKTSPALPKIKKMKDLLQIDDSSLTLSLLKNRLKDYNLNGDKKILGSHKKLQTNKLKINQFDLLNADNSKLVTKNSFTSPFNLGGKIINFGNLQMKKNDSSYIKK